MRERLGEIVLLLVICAWNSCIADLFLLIVTSVRFVLSQIKSTPIYPYPSNLPSGSKEHYYPRCPTAESMQ